MLSNAEIIGRVTMQTDFEKSNEIINQFKPTLKNAKYVEKIYDAVQDAFSEETFENRRLIFIAVIYQIYQPLSFLYENAGKLPVGIRDEMARCLGFVNPEMCNHYKTFTEPAMKPFNTGPERPFKVKVMEIVEKFKRFSINENDYQFKMSL